MASAASSPPKASTMSPFQNSEPLHMPRATTQYNNGTSSSAARPSLDGRYKADAPLTSSEHPFNPSPSIRIRFLPHGMTHDALSSMLLFAEDLVEANFIHSDLPDDTAFMTAVARFRTVDAAEEARSKLNGKMNSTGEASLVVELLPPYGERRSEDSDSIGQTLSNSTSLRSSNSNGKSSRPSSRFNSTFQSMGGRHASIASPSFNEAAVHDPSAQSLFDPAKPHRSTSFGEHFRITGKSVISGDGVDDDTGEILRDPLAFAKNGQNAMPRRNPSNSRGSLPISRMSNLTLNTSDNANPKGLHISPPSATGFRSLQTLQSPSSEVSPTALRSGILPSMSSTGGFPLSPQHLQRHHYPPANPADQNPPCNTLYVGNLPMDTSEDELKAVFSKQRGYKRLCFRTKHNGPMCFVEFEDVSFATKALNELYGHPLHNSVKGGIRLSFSKNPLGVRSGQANNLGPNSPLGSPTSMGFGNGLGAPPGFSAANGPPPGLGVPPGLSPPLSAGVGMSGFFNPNSPPSMSSKLHGHRGSVGAAFSSSTPSQHPQSPIGGSFH